jgi:hypothetical protein
MSHAELLGSARAMSARAAALLVEGKYDQALESYGLAIQYLDLLISELHGFDDPRVLSWRLEQISATAGLAIASMAAQRGDTPSIVADLQRLAEKGIPIGIEELPYAVCGHGNFSVDGGCLASPPCPPVV